MKRGRWRTRLVGLVVIGSLALANPACGVVDGHRVTRAEYLQVHKGDTRAHVQKVFDTHGSRVKTYTDKDGVVHLWKTYPGWDNNLVSVWFEKRRDRFHMYFKYLTARSVT